VADALVLNEGRLSVTSDAIDHLAAAVTTAGLAAPAAAVRPVAVPGPACVPPQRTRADRPLMVLLPRT
jgi:predicted pyridoxine 5'-phosphate oxidase superfamily flavin-nucleotide-binding protein